MAVTLTISRTLAPAQVSDSLEGGGTGWDIGSVANGSYAPLVDQPTNDGAEVFYFSHDAVIDPIFNVKFYIANFTLTGATYGGAKTPAQDLTDLIDLGNNSGSSKNNGDGLSGGLWMDMSYTATIAQQFDIGTRPNNVKIFGDNGTDGIDIASAFDLYTDAMFHTPDNIDKNAPTTAEVGKIGKSDDTVLGNRAEIRFRHYLPSAYLDGGFVQWATITRYTYTA